MFRKGALIEEFDDHNLIVIGSQATHAHLLGGDVANRSLTQIGFGTNATAEVFANAALTGAYMNSLGTPTYPATNEVSFPFSLGSADVNAFGLSISEFGLLTAGGVLYARRTRALPLNFNSDLSLSGTWVISF
ncbi:hypothetical protein D7S86_27035 [Pararobbsia silviterrae]|uniref:Uncharacterized protein n=1 Tax=Pararobbsia silviterrae TaxID=1792498 RepID=A0A494X1T2_9BURK|nr:hypothetical protein D7S86_27035 [Pararobbsia silviterrae]